MTQTSQLPNTLSFPSIPSLSLDNPNLLELVQNKQKKLDLGPVWAEEELRIFLKYFQKDGLKEIENMQAELTEAGYKRSVNNLFAVYMKNKNFLNYNPACTAQDLQAIMADHYENIEESIPSLDFPPLRKMKSAHSDEKIEMSRSSSKGPERIESAKMRMDDSLTLKKKSTSVKRTGHPVDEALFYQNYKPKKLHTSSSLIFQQRPKKERKSHATKGKFPLNFNYQDKN